ncbi:uncharacterized protein MONOS_5752 [Monocercomonoides exilis]|uniref:uncharacterized protein n=1 Tax=Monocercomonoides exilis TaxID=2049356 RepID=UPI00355A629E|nr:hypothetical protein MONOS_5752 [Monocercomonoides exilis]|eukprot:MONOS_5752.1-p1 / transcript=MONOS_5752.1 / gene=MONOS_5752 / organism=Monocercomonoides_exilis_PA203 / gene_product=unspecified product / transcript_product=unspecified product / location=Mono_scaffold00172:21724-24486(-) / protein_length=921 / sequence_SO=supercontig / SO=protein_coding / is_pseudo=false
MAVLKEKTADAERKGAETDIKQMKELRIFEEEKERDTKLELNKRREEDVRNRTEEEAAREDVIDRQESKRKEENRESDEKIIDERSVEDNLIEVRNKEIVGDNNKKDDEETKLSVENSEEDVSKEKEKGEKFVALSVGQSEECSAQNEKMQAQTECVNEKQIEVSSTTQEKEESLLINQTASNSDGVQSETQSGKIENAIIQNEVIKRTEERKDSVYNDDDSSEKAHTVSSPNGKGKCRSENPKNSILFKQNKPNKNLEADIESNAQSSSGDAFSQMWKQLIHIRTSPKKTDTTIKGSETSDCSSSSGSGDDIGLDLSHEIRKTEKNACDKRETKGDSPIKASAFSAKRTEIKLEIEIPNKIEDDQEAEKYEKDSPRNVSKADKNVANTNFVQQPTSVSNKMIDSQETFDEKLRKLLFKTFLEEEHLRNESAFNSYNIRSPSPTKLFDMKEIQQITLEHSSNEIQDSSSPSFSLSSKDEPIQPSSSDKSVESVEETLQPLEKSQKRNSKKQKENLQKTNSRPLSTRRIMVKSNEKFSKSTIQSQKNGKTLDLSKSLKHPSSSTSSSSSSAAASASSSTTTTAAAAATTTSSSSKTSSSTSSLNETSKKGTISNVKNEFNKTTSTEKKAFEKKISSVKQKAELSSTSSTKQLKPNKLLSSKEAPAKTCIDHSESAKTVQDSSDHKKESCLLLDEKPSEPIQDYPIADSSEFISHKPSQHITLKSSPDKLTSAKDESSLGLQSTQTSALPVFSVRALLNSKNPKLLESVISSPVLIQKLESSLPSEQLKNPQPSLRLHSPPSHSTNPHLTLTKSQVNTVSRTPLRSPRRQASNAPAPHYLTPTASSTRSTVFASAISLSTAAGPLTATSSTQLSPSLVPRSSSFRASAPPPLPVDPISSFSPSQPHLRRIMKTSYSSNSTFR